MNPFTELAKTIREQKEAAAGLTRTALDCSGSVCSFKLPKSVKVVKTDHQSHARPA